MNASTVLTEAQKRLAGNLCLNVGSGSGGGFTACSLGGAAAAAPASPSEASILAVQAWGYSPTTQTAMSAEQLAEITRIGDWQKATGNFKAPTKLHRAVRVNEPESLTDDQILDLFGGGMKSWSKTKGGARYYIGGTSQPQDGVIFTVERPNKDRVKMDFDSLKKWMSANNPDGAKKLDIYGDEGEYAGDFNKKFYEIASKSRVMVRDGGWSSRNGPVFHVEVTIKMREKPLEAILEAARIATMRVHPARYSPRP